MLRPFNFKSLTFITAGVMDHDRLLQLLNSKAHSNVLKGNVNLITIALPSL